MTETDGIPAVNPEPTDDAEDPTYTALETLRLDMRKPPGMRADTLQAALSSSLGGLAAIAADLHAEGGLQSSDLDEAEGKRRSPFVPRAASTPAGSAPAALEDEQPPVPTKPVSGLHDADAAADTTGSDAEVTTGDVPIADAGKVGEAGAVEADADADDADADEAGADEADAPEASAPTTGVEPALEASAPTNGVEPALEAWPSRPPQALGTLAGTDRGPSASSRLVASFNGMGGQHADPLEATPASGDDQSATETAGPGPRAPGSISVSGPLREPEPSASLPKVQWTFGTSRTSPVPPDAPAMPVPPSPPTGQSAPAPSLADGSVQETTPDAEDSDALDPNAQLQALLAGLRDAPATEPGLGVGRPITRDIHQVRRPATGSRAPSGAVLGLIVLAVIVVSALVTYLLLHG